MNEVGAVGDEDTSPSYRSNKPLTLEELEGFPNYDVRHTVLLGDLSVTRKLYAGWEFPTTNTPSVLARDADVSRFYHGVINPFGLPHGGRLHPIT